MAGDEIVLGTGRYSGRGNVDLSPEGKAITLRCSNPEDPATVAATIIDCQASSANSIGRFTSLAAKGQTRSSPG
jgi:hypothetical protein